MAIVYQDVPCTTCTMIQPPDNVITALLLVILAMDLNHPIVYLVYLLFNYTKVHVYQLVPLATILLFHIFVSLVMPIVQIA